MKIESFINQLNDLKISANSYLDKYHKDERVDMIEVRKDKLVLLGLAANQFDEPFDTEEDMVKNIVEYCQDKRKTKEETILEVGLYALAWDELLSSPLKTK